MFKQLVSKAPDCIQCELKKIYYKWKIYKGTFTSPEPEYADLHNLVKDGDWVIDIGANVGHYTVKLSNLVGPEGRVIAFEPIPITFLYLVENTKNCKNKNITLINSAVSDVTTEVGMSIPNFTSGVKNYYQANISTVNEESNTLVMTLTIDSFRIMHKVSLIKIDAEGHEPTVFKGMTNLIQRDKPIIIIETVTENIRNFLTKLGYSEIKYENSPNIVFKI